MKNQNIKSFQRGNPTIWLCWAYRDEDSLADEKIFVTLIFKEGEGSEYPFHVPSALCCVGNEFSQSFPRRTLFRVTSGSSSLPRLQVCLVLSTHLPRGSFYIFIYSDNAEQKSLTHYKTYWAKISLIWLSLIFGVEFVTSCTTGTITINIYSLNIKMRKKKKLIILKRCNRIHSATVVVISDNA